MMNKRGIIFQKNVSLAPLSTFRVGGRAEYFCMARTPNQLLAAILEAQKQRLPHRIFAGGSNVIFPDGLARGVVIRFLGGSIHSLSGPALLVDASVSLGHVVEKSLALGFRGLETLAGIPGTIGGAVVGNAGAYGHSIADVVRRIEVFDGKRRRWISRKQCRFGYRESIFKCEPLIVLRVHLSFRRGEARALKAVARGIVGERLKKYSSGIRCPGSFFKNVLVADVPRRLLARINKEKIIGGKIPAGYLLEEVGAKGMRYKQLAVADYHGNLIMNRGGATARDVRHFADTLRRNVERKFGIRLEEEIRYF